MDEKEKEKVFKVLNTVWMIAKKYCFGKIDDSVWTNFTKETSEKAKEFKDDKLTYLLFSDMIQELLKYMERKYNYNDKIYKRIHGEKKWHEDGLMNRLNG